MHAHITFLALLLSSIEAKPYKLKMLAFHPAPETLDGRTSMAALRQTVDFFNNQTVFLPDYHIDLTLANEGPFNANAPRQLLQFYDNYMDQAVEFRRNGSFIAPVVFGTLNLCHHTSRIVRQFNMVQFSAACNGIMYTANRASFPNLYKVIMTIDKLVTAAVHVVKYIGKWQEFAVITSLANSNEILASQTIYSESVKLGLRFTMFAGILEVEKEIFQDIISTQTRVIMLATTNIGLVAKFLCMAHREGIRGESYVFLTSMNTHFLPNSVLGCSASVFLEQFRITLWVGIFLSSNFPTGPSVLGYDAATFDRALDVAMSHSRFLDYQLRHAFHDGILAALLALDKAERVLQTLHNSSLKDFNVDPDLVMRMVNTSAASTDFQGIRAGRIFYSKRLEFDGEPLWVGQFLNGAWRLSHRFNFDEQNAIQSQELQTIAWNTTSGKPPKDLSTVLHRVYSYPATAKYVAITFSILLSAAQIAVAALIVKKGDRRFMLPDLMLLLASSIVNLTSMTFFFDATSITCYTMMILGILGMSLANGNLFTRVLMMTRLRTRSMKGTKFTKGTFRSLRSPFSPRPFSAASNRRGVLVLPLHPKSFILVGSACFTAANLVLTFIWLSLHPVFVKVSVSNMDFDQLQDKYYQISTPNCSSQGQDSFVAAVTAMHECFLILGSVLSIQVRRRHPPNGLKSEFKVSRYGVVNATFIYSLIVALCLIVPSKQVTLARSVLAFGFLGYSASTSGMVAYAARSK